MYIIFWIIGIILALVFAFFGFWTGSIVLVSITGNPSEAVSIIGGIIGMIMGILAGIGPVIILETMKKSKKVSSKRK